MICSHLNAPAATALLPAGLAVLVPMGDVGPLSDGERRGEAGATCLFDMIAVESGWESNEQVGFLSFTEYKIASPFRPIATELKQIAILASSHLRFA